MRVERDELNMGVVSRGILEQIRLAPDDRMEAVLAILNGELPTSSLDAIRAAVENPEYQLAVVEICSNCKGKGRFPGASSMPGYPTHSYINCRTCRGKGLVMVDLEGEEEE